MSILNWGIFGLKYDQKESIAFEDFSYLLFCSELENKIGLFRYKNQAGLETEPIIKDDIVYGFQAKYYTKKLSENKKDIVNSIQKAKRENSSLNIIRLYINKEFSESSRKGEKKPKYQIDIEFEAKKLSLIIEWRVPSHFEKLLLLPENKYIYDLFFSLEPNAGNLIDEIKDHTLNILRSIQTEINFKGQTIRINRTIEIRKIKQTIDNNQHLIISGEGGCGKTAIVKNFYSQELDYPICIFKATELKIKNINDLFRFAHNYSLVQFIEAYSSESKKLFIIDSAEKLAELNNFEILRDFIEMLQNNKWTIIFTTRHCYLDDLQFHMKQTYHLTCQILNIKDLEYQDLQMLSINSNFNLPANPKFRSRLLNLFYLNEFLKEYENIDKNNNLRYFIDLTWRKLIRGLVKSNNLDEEREECFIEIVRKRANSGQFYISTHGLSQPAVFALEQDDILNRDNDRGYFITHDIYEEWGLDKIIRKVFANYMDAKNFYLNIGESLPIRRAFRNWLSEQISENIIDIKDFITESFTGDGISQFWKDELLISILLSEYSESFFILFEKEIMADDSKFLNRICFLLRIACTEIVGTENFENSSLIITYPKGKGWEALIAFVYKVREEYLSNHLMLILPIITDWNNAYKEGNTTRLAGLLALNQIEMHSLTNEISLDKDLIFNLLKVIFNASKEIQKELAEIFDRVIANRWVHHNSPYEELCSKILEEPIYAIELIKTLPNYVINICNLCWQYTSDENDNGIGREEDIEFRYKLVDEYRYNYFPASALQTPILWLLKVAFNETLDFVIDLTNRAVEHFSKSDYGQAHVEEIVLHVNGKEINQYLSWSLWGTYRGIGSPEAPYLLQSIHMALEKILLDKALYTDSKIIEVILIQILEKSKSASLTAIVCSLVLAYPEKFSNVALILFKTIELLHIDSIRCLRESEIQSLYSIGFDPNKRFYTEERLKTCKDKHRKLSLESLFVNYQFFGISNLTEEEGTKFIESLNGIIDQHKIEIQSRSEEKKKIYGILLARIDRRTMHPTVIKQDNSNYIIELNPELAPDLKENSEQALNSFMSFSRYIPVKLWSMYKCEGNEKVGAYPKYEMNPLAALDEVKLVLEDLATKKIQLDPTDNYIPAFVCSALLRFYATKLTSQDIDFCKQIVINRINDVFKDTYNYQISDGVEAAVHTIPEIIKLFPEDIQQLKRILLFVLFDTSRIGEYKRICDYAIETIHKGNLWETMFEEIKSLFYDFIEVKPIYNKLKNDSHQFSDQFGHQKFSKQYKEIESLEFKKSELDQSNLTSLPIEDIEILFQILPDDTQDNDLLSIVSLIFPRLSQLLIKEERFDHLFRVRISAFRKIAKFILNRNLEDIKILFMPFLKKISGTEESKRLITELIFAEDNIRKPDQFWYVWDLLYEPIIKHKLGGYYENDVIIEYLLAWQLWREGAEEWHSLKEQNLSFYENAAKDRGNNPAILYSISKVLNSIGSHFVENGIKWIYKIIAYNKDLILLDMESNSIFYLEKIMRKFIFLNNERIKRESRLKKQLLQILDFMIERGSVHGYLLRESIF